MKSTSPHKHVIRTHAQARTIASQARTHARIICMCEHACAHACAQQRHAHMLPSFSGSSVPVPDSELVACGSYHLHRHDDSDGRDAAAAGWCAKLQALQRQQVLLGDMDARSTPKSPPAAPTQCT